MFIHFIFILNESLFTLFPFYNFNYIVTYRYQLFYKKFKNNCMGIQIIYYVSFIKF